MVFHTTRVSTTTKNRICNANKCNHTETWSMLHATFKSVNAMFILSSRWEPEWKCIVFTVHMACTWVFLNCQACALFNNYPIISRHCQYLTSRETTLLKMIWLSVSSTLYLWNVELSHPIGRWDGLCWQNRKTKMPKKILKRIIKLKRKTVNASI